MIRLATRSAVSIADAPVVRSRAGKLSDAYTHTSEPKPKLKPAVNTKMPTNPSHPAAPVRPPDGEHDDQQQRRGDHRGDAGQQRRPAAEAVDDRQRHDGRDERADLHERRQQQQRGVPGEAHLLEDQRAVEDDRVDAGDLDEEAQAEHEQRRAQVGRAQHLADRAAALARAGRPRSRRARARRRRPGRCARSVARASSRRPFIRYQRGGVGQPREDREHGERRDRRQREHEAPGARRPRARSRRSRRSRCR